MAQLSRQEVQSIVENARNRILERTVSRQEVQTISETGRDRVMTYMHDLVQIHQQQLFRRTNMQNAQLQRQLVAVETRIMSLEQDMKTIRQLLERLGQQEVVQHIHMPAIPETNTEKGYARHVYES